MKKNLFGAVAAGLALALAITSFGCESGHDDPIRIPTNEDAAVVAKRKFEYVANPTEYTQFETYTSNAWTGGTGGTPGLITTTTRNGDELPTYRSIVKKQDGSSYESDAVTDVNYSYSKYVNGVNSYNKTSGVWSGKSDKTKAIGDVVNTKSETITLDPDTKTLTWSKKSTKYEVRGLRTLTEVNFGDYSAVATYRTYRTHYYKPLAQTKAYDTLPYYILPTLSKYTTTYGTYDYAVTSFAAGDYNVGANYAFNAENNLPEGEYPYLRKGRVDSYSTADAVIDAAIVLAKNALDDAKVEVVLSAADRATAVENAEKNLAILQNLKKQAEYYNRGARYSFLDTETVDEKTTGSLKYYDDLNKTKLIDTEDKAATDAKKKAATAKYTITTNNTYLNATLVVTECTTSDGDKYVFTDDQDYYYKNDVRGVISTEFPVANTYSSTGTGPYYAGSTLQKAARTLKIANGVLTGTAVDINYANHTAKWNSTWSTFVNTWGKFGYFLGSSYPSFDVWYTGHKEEVTSVSNTETVDNNTSYSYVLKQ